VSIEDGPEMAVEFDLYSDRLAGIKTLRLCGRGPLFSRAVPGENYIPCLISPIRLGTAISIQSYGQPMRALENQGTIEFAIDEVLASVAFTDDVHWIGREFRAYEGVTSANNFVEDLTLVFTGRVTDVSHDTKVASIRTGDSSIDLDGPLVAELYPTSALPSIAGKPRPQVWGTVFCIEPVLIDDVNLIYEVSRTPLTEVLAVRVGGIEWQQSDIYPPGAGEWYVDLLTSLIALGSDTLGGDVRCDVIGEPVSGLGNLIVKIAAIFGLPVDGLALQTMDNLHTFDVGLYAREPVNGMNALDDAVVGSAAWWGETPTGLLTAGFVSPPSPVPDVPTRLDATNVLSMALNQTIPPAWRVPVEYERHWQTEGQFFEGVDEVEKQRWSVPGLKVSRENPAIKTAEPRAFDIPTMRSIVIESPNATTINNMFWEAWSVPRKVLSCEAWIDPREIKLYDTIAVDYMMFQGNFRIMSAVRAIGGGAAQLQLWG
jgi:hypothetical protein